MLLLSTGIGPVWADEAAPAAGERAETTSGTAPAEAEKPLPATLEEAVAALSAVLSEEDKDVIRNTQRDDLILFHHGFGTSIRNAYRLWGGNEALLLSACGGKPCHPDSASMRIIEALWEALQE